VWRAVAATLLLMLMAVVAARLIGTTGVFEPSFVVRLRSDLSMISSTTCWRTLCPGLTTWEDVRSLLASDPATTINDRNQAVNAINWEKRTDHVTEFGIAARATGGRMLGLLGLSVLHEQIVFGDVISLLGPPAVVMTSPFGAQVCYDHGVCLTMNVNRRLRPSSAIAIISFNGYRPRAVLFGVVNTFGTSERWQGFGKINQ
jgi:hypothetical protein